MEDLQRKKTGEFASFSYTERGKELAARVSALLTEAGYRCVGAEVEEAFRRCDLLVFVGASGIAVRKIAPYVRDKFQDPAVLCLDEYGRFVIPLLSGHVGGANAFARFLGRKLGAAVAISTATDLNRRFAVDVFAVQNGLRIGSREKAKRVSAALLRGEEVAFSSDFPLRDTEKLPEGLVAKPPAEGQLCIRISAAPDPEAEGAAYATRHAMKMAGWRPEQVDYVNAHGTSTGLNDKMESFMIHKVFGERAKDVTVTSTKSMIGHCLGAAGGLEVIASLQAIEENYIHPTLNYTTPDPECDITLSTGRGVERKVDRLLVNSFGFGGHNGVLAFQRCE